MQTSKLALIGFSALALTAYGSLFASSHEDAAATEKKKKCRRRPTRPRVRR